MYTSAENPKVLIVDDDPAFLCDLSALLCRAGFQVETAADVKSAEPILTQEEPGIDLLVMDLVLPGQMSGFDVIAALARPAGATPERAGPALAVPPVARPPFKIIATSGVYGDRVVESVCKRMGASAFVEKTRPGERFNAAEWVHTVRRVLGVGRHVMAAGFGR